MGSLERRVAALEVAPRRSVQPVNVDNHAKIKSVIARELGGREYQDSRGLFGDEEPKFIAMCQRIEAGHATLEDERIMAAIEAVWIAVPDFDCREYVFAFGSALADF